MRGTSLPWARSQSVKLAGQHLPNVCRRLFSAAATLTFLVALPAAAWACVTPFQCLNAGGTVSGKTCVGGAFPNTPICQALTKKETKAIKKKQEEEDKKQEEEDKKKQDIRRNTAAKYLTPLPFIGSGAESMGQQAAAGLMSGLGSGAGLSGAHLGLYTTPAPNLNTSLSVYGGGAGVQNDGYGAKDSAGLLAPGTQTPDFDAGVGTTGIQGSLDATRLFGLAGNQQLTVNGRFDYLNDSVDYKRTPVQIQLGAFSGSLDRNTYAFSGGFNYTANATYLGGIGGGAFGDGTLKNTVTGGKGDFDSNAYYFDMTLGHVFKLSETPGRRVWGLDLSGHGGYFDWRDDGFTDSAGFAYGNENTHYGLIGGRAKLFVGLRGDNKIWMPYVAGTVDGQLDYSHTLAIPNQTLSPADTITFSQGNTFGGVETGVDVFCVSGITGGISGFYQGSSDTDIEGGRAYLTIPFGRTRQTTLLK